MRLHSPNSRAGSDTEIARKLNAVHQAVDLVTAQEDLANFLKNPDNAQKLNDLVEDIQYALIEYQVRTPKRLAFNVSDICLRLRDNERSTTKAVRRL